MILTFIEVLIATLVGLGAIAFFAVGLVKLIDRVRQK